MTALPQDFPTSIQPTAKVAQAVIAGYAHLHTLDESQVRDSFGGGVPFDSVLGVELASLIEDLLAIKIPEKMLMNTKVYESLATFASMVQFCINETDAAVAAKSQ